ncbi:hypothetical protein LWC35_11660 [Pseudonocardia kujensis]|uniref:MarR family winged helix-turn-helix transcriptional regulator n=1 Tax=Pseudonocardia kujensis TaxID=1128675 RepID=UPI001E4D52B6|nr:hypothetical protein [Pseudonocardia kujensis]MCE0763554.1 hypothetical protein [Pseudonocardia kujensis]
MTTGQAMSQPSVLGRIGGSCPITARELARAEHARARSIAETVTMLKKQGLIDAHPDPTDGRKSLLSVTTAGQRLIDSVVDRRGAWLAWAIGQHVIPGEREMLADAAQIIAKMADCRVDTAPDEALRV